MDEKKDLGKKMRSATKWSAVTQLFAKLVSPITTMVLARLLTPEAFGIVATLTMVISFAEIFTDAGFQIKKNLLMLLFGVTWQCH